MPENRTDELTGTSAWEIIKPNLDGRALISTDALLDQVYRSAYANAADAGFVINRCARLHMDRLRDGNNYALWQPTKEEHALWELMGYPVFKIEAIPGVSDEDVGIAFGLFRPQSARWAAVAEATEPGSALRPHITYVPFRVA